MIASLRVLFFSHDRRGLGHIRRTLALADLLLDYLPYSTVLIVTGSRMAHAFRTRPRLDYVKLPSITRAADDGYVPSTLNIPLDEILKMREDLLLHATRSFRPDVFMADSPPLAGTGELARTISYIRMNMLQTVVVLNLRDILDEPTRVATLWEQHHVMDSLDKDYDLILIHGSQRVYDLPLEYGFSEELRAKTLFCGYVPRSYDAASAEIVRRRVCAEDSKLVVVTVGGGGDGALLIERCLIAATSVKTRNKVHMLVILGPDMPPVESEALRIRYGKNTNVDILDFVDPAMNYLAAADVIISMGGYNTLSEIAALRKCAIIVPRVNHSTEQLIRARCFDELGFVKMLHPDHATPARIATMISDVTNKLWAPQKSLEFGDVVMFARIIQDMVCSRICKDALI